MFLIRAISLLPLSILYILADFIFFLAYYITGYRKKVIITNLRQSFPEKSNQEINIIAHQFYRHLADLIVETLYGLSISDEELLKRVTIKNMDDLTRYYEDGLSIIIMSSHNNNWEWLTIATSHMAKAEPDGIYQRLSNPSFEKLMMDIRTRFGTRMIEKKNALRDLLHRRDILKMVGMISDQSPIYRENKYWTTFLHQETAFFMGTERMAKKLNMPVVYAKMEKVKRGYYNVEYIKIDEPPFNPEPDYITRRFVELLEEQILESPAFWLWSHKRWKLKREA